MGYRSDVVITCGEYAYNLLSEACEGNRFKPDVSVDYDDGSHMMRWNNVKWYEYFREIADIERILDEIENAGENDFEKAFCFLRVGEESGDAESRVNSPGYGLYHQPYITISVL